MRNFFAGLSGGTGAFAVAGLFLVLIAAGFYVQSGRNTSDLATKLGLVAAPEETEAVPAVAKPAVTEAGPEVAEPEAAPEVVEPEAAPEVVEPEAEPEVVEAEAAPEVVEAEAEATVAETEADEELAQTATEPEQEVAEVAPTTEPEATLDPAPVFDEVRREADGVTVIAGQAIPGAEVQVLQNGVVIAQATADASGKFATIALTPPDGKGHVLSLLQKMNGKETASLDEIILAPRAPLVVVEEETAPPPQVPSQETTDETVVVAQGSAKAEPVVKPENAVPEIELAETILQEESTTPSQPVAEDAETTVEPQEEPAPEIELALADPVADKVVPDQEEPATEALPTPAPAPVAVLKSTAQGIELLNTPSPQAMANVALDTISYSEVGEVELAGRAQTDTASVRVYLNNTSVINLPVDAQGRWRGELPNVDEGIYTLRVDEVSTTGQVTSRVETPFKRESTEVLVAAAEGQDGPLSAITVQEGATLWAIARERYGDGALYVRVFEANSAAIRDPDLIYPGQIFDLPE